MSARLSSPPLPLQRAGKSRATKPGYVHAVRLGLCLAHAVVADVRRRHDDDLPRVGGIRQDLLVAAHRRVEDDLAERRTRPADRLAAVGGAVFEDEQPLHAERPDDGGEIAHLPHELLEHLGEQRLRSVGERELGVIVHFDEQPVRADGDGRARERQHFLSLAGSVRRIHEDRQVRDPLDVGDRREIERVPGVVDERPHAALAEDHLVVALREQVLGRQQQLLDRGRHAALQKHRLAQASEPLQEREVLHVPRADLQTVGVLGDDVDRLGVEHFGHDRQSRLRAHARKDAAGPRAPRPWNEYGDVRGLKAPPR